jgi:spoIIIJ-associated protein
MSETSLSRLDEEGEKAADYLEELLNIADLDGDLEIYVENGRPIVEITGGSLSSLVGEEGEVLEALQELSRLAVHAAMGERTRLLLDIDGHRAARRTALVERAKVAISEVQSTGVAVAMPPMNPFERKVVHDAVAEAGLTSESEGEEPGRHVVILPA